MEIVLEEDLSQAVYEKFREVARAKRIITYGELGAITCLGGHDPRSWRMLKTLIDMSTNKAIPCFQLL